MNVDILKITPGKQILGGNLEFPVSSFYCCLKVLTLKGGSAAYNVAFLFTALKIILLLIGGGQDFVTFSIYFSLT